MMEILISDHQSYNLGLLLEERYHQALTTCFLLMIHLIYAISNSKWNKHLLEVPSNGVSGCQLYLQTYLRLSEILSLYQFTLLKAIYFTFCSLLGFRHWQYDLKKGGILEN